MKLSEQKGRESMDKKQLTRKIQRISRISLIAMVAYGALNIFGMLSGSEIRKDYTLHIDHHNFHVTDIIYLAAFLAIFFSIVAGFVTAFMLLNELGSYLTENQRKYVDAMVQYMSTDLAELGNEASMQTYGIKKFTETEAF